MNFEVQNYFTITGISHIANSLFHYELFMELFEKGHRLEQWRNLPLDTSEPKRNLKIEGIKQP